MRPSSHFLCPTDRSTPKPEAEGILGLARQRIEVVFVEADDELLGLEPEAVVQELWGMQCITPQTRT